MNKPQIIIVPMLQRSSLYISNVIPAGKRVSSAMDGKLRAIHAAWIPAIPAGMTEDLYKDARSSVPKHKATAHTMLQLGAAG